MSYNTETQAEYKNYQTANSIYPNSSNKQQLILNMGDINTPINNSLQTALSQINQNFYKINVLEIEPTTQNIEKNIFEEDLIMVMDNLVNLYLKEINKGKEEKLRKKFILNYLNNHKFNLQEIYYWLINNQTCPNSIYLLGYFNYYGIEIDINKHNAFNLYQKAAELGNIVVQYDLANMYIYGEGSDKDYEKAFELSKKLTAGNYTCGINLLGYCYECNIGTDVNGQKAFELYQIAADLGNIFGMYNLGRCYKGGFGTNINNKKAFELFQRAANFEYSPAQQSLAWMYEKGRGTEKSMELAIYWYKKSAKQGSVYAKNKLKQLLEE